MEDVIQNTNNENNKYLNSINNNSNIVNLSELSKEYERDEYIMNNEFMNNNTVGGPVEANNSAPAFGGRFFPSLEDEPTNMGFNTNIESPATMTAPPTNNFIDLTDLGNPSFPQQNVNPMPNLNQEISQPLAPDFMNNMNQVPQNNDNIINLSNLTQNTNMVDSMSQPNLNNVAGVNNDFGSSISDIGMESVNPSSMPEVMPVNQTPVMSEQPIMNSQPLPSFGAMAQNIGPMVTAEPVVTNQFNAGPTDNLIPNIGMESVNQSPMPEVMPINQTQVMPEQPIMDSQPLQNFGVMPQNIEPMPTVEPNIGPMPAIEPVINNQFDMSQNMMPTQEVQPTPIVEPNVEFNQSIQPTIPNLNQDFTQPIAPEFNNTVNPMPVVDNTPVEQVINPPIENILVEQPVVVENVPTNEFPQKDVLPVINTLKAVGVNLENFGYTIRITDEDLPNSYKITIEVDK